MEEPSNMELMRAIGGLRDDMKEGFGELRNCLWGPNRDNGLVTATAGNTQRICRLERIVYGVIGAICTMMVSVGTALVLGVI